MSDGREYRKQPTGYEGIDGNPRGASYAGTPGKRTLTETLPIQRKGRDPARDVDPASLAPSGGGRALPDGVRGDMEQSFGTSFADVRIHEGSRAQSVGALAYTQGNDIHFAPGRFDSESRSGRELLGHELAHVVQQRAGRVAVPQGKGAPVNADTSLEAEADAAGARAAAGQAAGLSGSAGGTGGGAIQRAVGFEFEIGTWTTEKEENGHRSPMAKGDKIIRGDRFNVEADEMGGTSDLEVVTKPLLDKSDAEGVIGAAQEIAAGFWARKAQAPVKASLFGGSDNILVTPGAKPVAKMQASPAIALENMAAFYEQMDTPQKFVVKQVRAVLADDKTKEMLGGDPSKALEGLLVLIVDFMNQGLAKAPRLYPKSLFTVMARTSFTKMFSLIPEHEFFGKKENLDKWVGLVMSVFARFPLPDNIKKSDQPVLNATFTEMENVPDQDGKKGDKQEAYQLGTTRDEWLRNMPEKDLLSNKTDKRFEGMGAYDDLTDKIVEEGAKLVVDVIKSVSPPEEQNGEQDGEQGVESQEQAPKVETPKPQREAPLFELRGLKEFGLEDQQEVAIGSWVSAANNIFDLITKVQKEKFQATGKGPNIQGGENGGQWNKVDQPDLGAKTVNSAPTVNVQPTTLQAQPQQPPPKAKQKKKWIWPFSKLFG